MKIKSVFPFQLVPDEIQLDDEQVIIIRRGFLTRTKIPIKLPDLLNVILHEAPVFCTVEILYKYMTAKHEKITHITLEDGRKFQAACMQVIKKHKNSIDSTSN